MNSKISKIKKNASYAIKSDLHFLNLLLSSSFEQAKRKSSAPKLIDIVNNT